MTRLTIFALLFSALAGPGEAHIATERMAATVMQEWPAGVVATTRKPGEWGYEEGVLLDGLAAEWTQSHNPAELTYIRQAVDKYVRADGTLQTNASGRAFAAEEHQLDNLELGRAILFCFRQTHAARYRSAATFLHGQLQAQPRGPSGGFWHKQIYPNQMWLDGAYMAEPFRAQYAALFGAAPGEWDDIARQFVLMDQHMRDPRTGLLRHGWDESKQMAWADKQTGLSPEVWGRALGWYAMALVDVLDWMPSNQPGRAQLIVILRRLMPLVVKYQKRGLWWEVLDKPAASLPRVPGPDGDSVQGLTDPQNGNFPESSASAMFVYALAKGTRKGYLDPTLRKPAEAGWEAIQKTFVAPEGTGQVKLTGTVKAAGLGGTPYRPGTFDYYVHEATGEQDAKGVGAYLLAGSEMEQRVR